MACVLATTTWNSIGLIGPFLAHYRKLGFLRALVMDFDSVDGTRDVLISPAWREFVELVPFPGLALLDSSNVMLSIAARAFRPVDWCLFCDPDELLVTPSMSVDDLTQPDLVLDAESVSIPRRNVTAPLSVARDDDTRLTACDALTLRIDRRCVRSSDEDAQKDDLSPPWVFSAIAGKMLVRLGATVAVGEGDHSARTLHDTVVTARPGVYLLHYPIRGYAAFRNKIELARVGFAANPQLTQEHGWQLRRWIRLADSGGLYGEYLQQFVVDEHLGVLLHDGTLCRDERVRIFHQRC